MEEMKALSISKLRKPNDPVRVALHALLPLLLFLLYHSSSLHSINPSSVLQSLVTQFISRKVMFIFFNAILLFLFLARDSGMLSPSSSSSSLVADIYDEFHMKKRKKVATAEAMVAEEPVGEKALVVVAAESLESAAVEGAAEGEAVDELAGGDGAEMEEVGVDEREPERLGVEEWNRRFEEFIERVNRERKMEALQLVRVNKAQSFTDFP